MKGKAKSSPVSTIQSLDRALTLLEHVGSPPDGTLPQLSDLAKLMDMDRSSIFRMLNTFAQHKLVSYNQSNRQYQLGTAVFALAGLAGRHLRLPGLVGPHLHNLQKVFGETAHLAVLSGNRAVFIEGVTGRQPVTIRHEVGDSVDLHCTAVGKALLMDHSLATLKELLGSSPLKKFTSHTPHTIKDVFQQISAHKKEGVSIDDNQRDEGVFCMAAPVRDYHGSIVGALGVSGISHRLKPRQKEVAALLLESVASISGLLGWKGPTKGEGCGREKAQLGTGNFTRRSKAAKPRRFGNR
ncbi:MAG: IclR family transcriptional regulator [Verrucomicrobiota bacterium]|nr:IclR family transcriptional regulator [Verrucomicrobiota bacterium]